MYFLLTINTKALNTFPMNQGKTAQNFQIPV